MSNNKYLNFKIIKETIEENSKINVIIENLSYREALKVFKEERIKLENTLKEPIYLTLKGILDDSSETIIRKKEIVPLNQACCENAIEDRDSNEIALTSKDILDDEESTSNTGIEFNEYVKDIENSIKEIEMQDSKLQNKENKTDLILNDIDFKSLNLKSLYRHISEVETKDILKVLIDIFNILEDKHKYNLDMINLLEKKRDCYYHDFENLDKMEFDSLEEKKEFMVNLGFNMHDLSYERRKFKHEHTITDKVFSNLSKVKCSDYTALSAIKVNEPKFNLDKAVNLKTYIYNYNTIEERNFLLNNLNSKYDKVIDVKWGVIECYYKVGSNKSKKAEETNDLGINKKIDIIDEVSAKNYESIVNETVPYGKTFLKAKGSTVKLTNISKKSVNALAKNIHNKYTKCAYDINSSTLYLIERVK